MGHNARLGKVDNDTRYVGVIMGSMFWLRLSTDVAGIYLSMEDFGKAEENYLATVRIFEYMGVTKQKRQFPPIKTFQGVVKRVVRSTKREENWRWGLKMLIPLSREVTNRKLRSTPVWHWFCLSQWTWQSCHFPKTFFTWLLNLKRWNGTRERNLRHSTKRKRNEVNTIYLMVFKCT